MGAEPCNTMYDAPVSTKASHRIFASGSARFSIFTAATILPAFIPPSEMSTVA
jgi:hypothetical protein